MGKVYLVGAGPGYVNYLTVKAHQLLNQAEVLIYDALVDSSLLQLVKSECLKLDVGKRGGKVSTPQTEINRLLVEHCQQDKLVVRLKSGDPFIFGRCTAEIEALRSAGCAFEVVPGISSALAAPLLAGIPLTDPVLSRCFAVFTAHEPDELDWEALAQIETLVVLMGGQHLAEIVHQLARHGKSLHTPIAIIRWASSPQQQVWVADLENIVAKTREISLSPVVIVVGEVVRLRNYLQPPSMPLTGKTILVTRSLGQSSQFSNLLQQQGATVIEMPALEIVPPSSWDELDRAIAHLLEFDWLILTSTNGVDYFFERLAAQNRDARALAGVKIAVVGEKTAQCLNKYGLQPDFIPPDFVADALVEHLQAQLKGKKVLFPRVESGGREVLVKELTAIGAEVVEVAAYQSQCPSAIAPAALEALQSGIIDIITFASSKTVKCFYQLLKTHGEADLARVCIASIGPQTSKTCLELLGRVDVEATEYTLEGLTQAIVQWANDN
ncbi:uroporphyrinogen-III C-methyltransferase [Aliterella atlantica]|uniref:uroporphyrinogen-III C-methyltransferase n=1 Tax=Aliterella atlantica CENA595 TaxID=1618023 RepID=A0A0D8ZP26_9CYAN|nr:uroporphyrinogen-III C-methyltransferase [Aliterella atlantica]KJH70107.1 porphyrin biosynthesis protein [Aliterella atlantica CENA595]